ncbi:dTMP kinase [Natronoglycomyces albus]|uniref:Thymidylate kinase n=1 Tax=Natronoglycomyces albus TaxID=2811108 RepID=A0A895XR91_9ACTN|nr:dTMP kinase [Natronoglycomyces albus]QSB05685.1 dTMP kinase [Natronoglycomyces albus]
MSDPAADLKAVLRIPPFRRLWTVLGLASFGDWLGLFASAAFAQSLFEGAAAKGAAFSGVIILRLLPALIFGPIAGIFADRFDRRKTMVTCDIARFLLLGSIPTVYLATGSVGVTIVWIMIAQVAIEAVVMVWMPAKEAAMPNLLPKSKLEMANQLTLATTYGIAPVLAFGLMAILERGSGVWGNLGMWAQPMVIGLYINSLMFLIVALTVYFGIKEISGRPEGRPDSQNSMWRDFADGWRYVQEQQLVRGLVVGILGAFCGAGILIGSGQTYAESLDAGSAAFNTLAATLFIGLGIGIVAGPKIVGALSRRRWFGMSIVLAGIGLLFNAVAPLLGLALIGTAIIGAGAGMAFLAGITLLQREVSDQVRGRIFAFIGTAVRVILMLTISLGATLAGLGATRQVQLGAVEFTWSFSRLIMLIAAVFVIIIGLMAFKRMDDKPGVPALADLWASLRGRPLIPTTPGNGTGFFIVFEGGEGSGKSTQALKLSAWLKLQGYEAVRTREPGGTQIGARIRSMLLSSTSETPSARCEALLYAADRAHHVDTIVRPALERGAVVVSDRYIDSSIAYQGSGRALGGEEISWLSDWATKNLRPDLVVLLDIAPETGLRRAKHDGNGDRLEQESLDFHSRVREAFLLKAKGNQRNYLVVDASKSPEAIAEEVQSVVAARLGVLPKGESLATGHSPWPEFDDGATGSNGGNPASSPEATAAPAAGPGEADTDSGEPGSPTAHQGAWEASRK